MDPRVLLLPYCEILIENREFHSLYKSDNFMSSTERHRILVYSAQCKFCNSCQYAITSGQ